jgi:hypothetical protein
MGNQLERNCNIYPSHRNNNQLSKLYQYFAKHRIPWDRNGKEKKRALQYNLNWEESLMMPAVQAQLWHRRQKFQTTLNAEILLENCDGTEIQAADSIRETQAMEQLYGMAQVFTTGMHREEVIKM